MPIYSPLQYAVSIDGKMDYALLRKQKEDLVEVIEMLGANDEQTGGSHRQSLQGILNLIDSLQDAAYEYLGQSLTCVFGETIFDDE